jgi:hypothetical protein
MAEEKKHLEDPDVDVKILLKYVLKKSVAWIHLARHTDQLGMFVANELNLLFQLIMGIVLTGWVTISFSKGPFCMESYYSGYSLNDRNCFNENNCQQKLSLIE